MFKLIVKLAITALVANAAYHVGAEYLNYVRFRDAIREAAMFKARNDDELRVRIMDLSSQFDIPLTEDAIAIHREDRRVSVEGHYAKGIELAPTVTYDWPFSWSMEVMTSTLLAPLPRK
jgi:hypothetical protein